MMSVSPDSPLRLHDFLQLDGIRIQLKLWEYGDDPNVISKYRLLWVKDRKNRADQELYATAIYSAVEHTGMLPPLAQLIAEYVPPLFTLFNFPTFQRQVLPGVGAVSSMTVMCFVSPAVDRDAAHLSVVPHEGICVYHPELVEEEADFHRRGILREGVQLPQPSVASIQDGQTLYVAPRDRFEEGTMIHLLIEPQEEFTVGLNIDQLMRTKMQLYEQRLQNERLTRVFNFFRYHYHPAARPTVL